MFTTCTHCQTRFKVTAKQLKAADGQVRCGKCEQVFDAYENLESKKTQKAPALEPVTEPAELSVTLGSGTTPDLNVRLAAEAEPPAEALDLHAELLKPEVPSIEDLFAELPDERDLKPLPAPLSGAPDIEPVTDPPKTVPTHEDFPHADELPAPRPTKPARPAHALAWWSGLTLLALLLLAQLVNADREALAQNLVLGPSLEAVYAALGDPLPTAQSVDEWDVSELNVTSDPDLPGALSITGSLANHAAYAQPWPVLRVVLTDRVGDTLRARDFKPAEYLPGTQANVRLAGGQASRFRLDIVDPGADAVGFSLSPCLDAPGGRICSTPEHD